jgi:hypothetical protein
MKALSTRLLQNALWQRISGKIFTGTKKEKLLLWLAMNWLGRSTVVSWNKRGCGELHTMLPIRALVPNA